MRQAFISYLFGAPMPDIHNPKAKAVYNRNYWFGETLAEIKIRRLKKQHNLDLATNSSIPFFRSTNHLLNIPPTEDEIRHNLVGPYSNRTYKYVKPG